MADLLDPAERSARGHAIQSDVLGQPASEPTTLHEESWRDFVYAEVWSRPGLDRRARYLTAIAGAAMCDAPDDVLDGYVRGAVAGRHLTLGEMREAALHLAVYGGWGRGQRIDRSASRVAQSLGLPAAECEPIRAAPWDPATRTEEGQQEFVDTMTFAGGPSATPLLEAINDFVFGELWRRRGLDQRSRRFLTMVGVAESSSEIPMRSHFHAAMASGNCTPDELQEFVLQYAIHAGWPKASVVQGVLFEMIRKVEAGLPWNG